MIKFDVLSRFSNDIKFTAEIDCDENAEESVKLGLAARWGVKNRANLDGANLDRASLYRASLYRANLVGANLHRANLDGANLHRANLVRADLVGANLHRANLDGANLDGADLDGANLHRANLVGANLHRANLVGANLDGADLYRANLDGANLQGANLHGANLQGANLHGADLVGANSGINEYLKSIQVETYPICYTSDVMQIGCELHKLNEWMEFDDHRILEMDGKSALKFWRKYKDWIFQAIELAPAKDTGYVKPD